MIENFVSSGLLGFCLTRDLDSDWTFSPLISSHSLRGSTWSGLSVQVIGELDSMGLCLS